MYKSEIGNILQKMLPKFESNKVFINVKWLVVFITRLTFYDVNMSQSVY